MNDYSELTAARRRERILQLLQEKEAIAQQAQANETAEAEN